MRPATRQGELSISLDPAFPTRPATLARLSRAPWLPARRRGLLICRCLGISRCLSLGPRRHVDLPQVLRHRPENEEQYDAHAEDDEERDRSRLIQDAVRGGQNYHSRTFSRIPANRSSSGLPVSTRDLAR